MQLCWWSQHVPVLSPRWSHLSWADPNTGKYWHWPLSGYFCWQAKSPALYKPHFSWAKALTSNLKKDLRSGCDSWGFMDVSQRVSSAWTLFPQLPGNAVRNLPQVIDLVTMQEGDLLAREVQDSYGRAQSCPKTRGPVWKCSGTQLALPCSMIHCSIPHCGHDQCYLVQVTHSFVFSMPHVHRETAELEAEGTKWVWGDTPLPLGMSIRQSLKPKALWGHHHV